MAKRNDDVIAASSEAVAHAMQNQHNAGRLEATGEVNTWVMFTREFLRKYFPEDVRGKKDMEFLASKQGNSTVTEYDAKFVELVKFYPHYIEDTDVFLKCIKFESEMRSEIKGAIGYQQICRSAKVVNNCRIYEEVSIAHSTHYKCLKEKRWEPHHDRKKPYDALAKKGKQKVSDWKKTSGVGTPATV
ncbi:uncharacterized protein LOC131597807 [Vicia villosa]|uniref:uncharacterized protein LOC131597807 n=1 Tax=Vicia villosa TaxID=3911 RepID=UPI00273BAF47|nr:uncharacterized protein LOC131597807 [Vicia villosa]